MNACGILAFKMRTQNRQKMEMLSSPWRVTTAEEALTPRSVEKVYNAAYAPKKVVKNWNKTKLCLQRDGHKTYLERDMVNLCGGDNEGRTEVIVTMQKSPTKVFFSHASMRLWMLVGDAVQLVLLVSTGRSIVGIARLPSNCN